MGLVNLLFKSFELYKGMKFVSTINQSKTCGVYRIHNTARNKTYIGSSKTVEYRCYEHRKNLRKNKHVNQHLQNAWNKYGESCFLFELIEECAVGELLKKEQKLIDDSMSANRRYGYNICEVANKPTMTVEVRSKISRSLVGNTPWNLGVPHSNESKDKMRQAKLGVCGSNHAKFGKPVSAATRDRIRQGNLEWNRKNFAVWLGKTHTDQTKEKIRQSRIGKPLSEDTKAKISASNKGRSISETTKRKISESNKSQRKPVEQFMDGILVQVFESVSDARRQTGVRKIAECAAGKRKSAGGYVWSFSIAAAIKPTNKADGFCNLDLNSGCAWVPMKYGWAFWSSSIISTKPPFGCVPVT
jgi:group I intron endonuclease